MESWNQSYELSLLLHLTVVMQEVAQVMQDVDILIIFMTFPYFSFYYKEFFFDYMFSDTLVKCCHILIRIQSHAHLYDPKTYYNHPPPPSDLDDVISRHGLDRKKIKAKISESIAIVVHASLQYT